MHEVVNVRLFAAGGRFDHSFVCCERSTCSGAAGERAIAIHMFPVAPRLAVVDTESPAIIPRQIAVRSVDVRPCMQVGLIGLDGWPEIVAASWTSRQFARVSSACARAVATVSGLHRAALVLGCELLLLDYRVDGSSSELVAVLGLLDFHFCGNKHCKLSAEGEHRLAVVLRDV